MNRRVKNKEAIKPLVSMRIFSLCLWLYFLYSFAFWLAQYDVFADTVLNKNAEHRWAKFQISYLDELIIIIIAPILIVLKYTNSRYFWISSIIFVGWILKSSVITVVWINQSSLELEDNSHLSILFTSIFLFSKLLLSLYIYSMLCFEKRKIECYKIDGIGKYTLNFIVFCASFFSIRNEVISVSRLMLEEGYVDKINAVYGISYCISTFSGLIVVILMCVCAVLSIQRNA